MKFLGWMHRKFQHKVSEPFNDFSIGNSCGQPSSNHYKDNNNYFKNQSLLENYDHHHHEGDHVIKSDEEEDGSELSGMFHGFLSIGTLGTNSAVYDDPSATPTFFISVDNIMEKETQVAQDDVKLINDELEKVLVNDESCNLSSGRSSHCSTITLNPKPRESTENTIISFPLQTYLLGSSMEYQETTSITNYSSGNNRRQTRVSVTLGELFQKKKPNEEGEDDEDGTNEMKMMEKKKKADKSGVFILKKILKRKKKHAETRRSTANEGSGGTNDSVSSDKKLQKILQIFHRKIHPENSTTTKKTITTKLGLKGAIKTCANGLAHQKGCPSHEKMRPNESPSNAAQMELNGSCPFEIGPGGHWIKSDSDFVVLEL